MPPSSSTSSSEVVPGPRGAGPSGPGPSAAGPSVAGPSVAGPSVAGPRDAEPGGARAAARPWLLALGVIALVEAAVAVWVPVRAPVDLGLRFYRGDTEPTFTEGVLHGQTRRLDTLEAPPTVAVLGDSSGLTGVIPSVVLEGLVSQAPSPEVGAAWRSAVRVENLCTVAPVGLAGQLDLLDRLLAAGPAPAVVVLYTSAATLATGDAERARIGLGPAFRAWLGAEPGPASVWPSHRLRPYVARALVNAAPPPARRNQAELEAFMAEHHGFVRELEGGRRDLAQGRLVVPIHPDALPPIERLLQAAQTRRFKVLWVNALVAHDDLDVGARADHARNAALLAAIAAQAPALVVAEPYLRPLPGSDFGTESHPLLPAAQRNSYWLGASLAPLLAPPPAPAPAPSPTPTPPSPGSAPSADPQGTSP